MKKNFIFLLLFALSAYVAAQGTEKLPFSLGPAIGTNVPRLSTRVNNPLITGFKTLDIIGFHGGIFARIYYHKLYFQPEIMVFVKGGKCTYTALVADPNNPGQTVPAGIQQNLKITSLDIPLLIGYNLGRNLLNFRIFAGPVGSYTLAEKLKFTSDVINLPETDPLKMKDVAWSVTGGIGMDIWKFFIDARYERGLNNVSRNKSFTQHPSSFVLTIGWKTF